MKILIRSNKIWVNNLQNENYMDVLNVSLKAFMLE